MPPDFTLHPVLYVAEALGGVASPKVIDPAPENGVNQKYHRSDRLRLVASEDVLELLQQFGARLEPGRPHHKQFTLTAAPQPEVKAHESEAILAP